MAKQKIEASEVGKNVLFAGFGNRAKQLAAQERKAMGGKSLRTAQRKMR